MMSRCGAFCEKIYARARNGGVEEKTVRGYNFFRCAQKIIGNLVDFFPMTLYNEII